MKLPSVQILAQKATATLRRFPWVLGTSITSAALGCYLAGHSDGGPEFTRLLFTSSLGIPLFFALALFLEKPPAGLRPRAFVMNLSGLVFLSVYYFFARKDDTTLFYAFYFQLSLALHLAVAFAAFLSTGEINGFWHFNKSLFRRFVMSFIYASVLFGGLALALVAMDRLFEITIKSETYGRLWILTVYVFQTWHFLAGTPASLKELEGETEYPTDLKIFSQYLLVPLVTVYAGILYAYMAKIIVTWHWPQGLVAWLVSGMSIFGIITLLLVYPVRNREGNRWIGAYTRVFYLAVLPLLAMLFLSLYQRVRQYGITENRYFLFVLGLWLFGLCLYFLKDGVHNIKAIPVSLAVLALLTAFGPWGAYGVSLRSQSARLEALLQKNRLFAGGRLQKAQGAVSWEERKEMSSILDYLVSSHGPKSLARWTDLDLIQAKDKTHSASTEIPVAVMRSMGLDHVSRWEQVKDSDVFGYYLPYDRGRRLDVRGFDSLVQLNVSAETTALEGLGMTARLDAREGVLALVSPSGRSLKLELATGVMALRADSSKITPERMTFEAESDWLRARFCIENMTGRMKNERPEISYANGTLLIHEK